MFCVIKVEFLYCLSVCVLALHVYIYVLECNNVQVNLNITPFNHYQIEV